jgi:cytidine deaminase
MTVPKARLLAAARRAMHHAYAPYSEFQVGAAVLLENGAVFTGCNVENASYGLTVCAERNAIFAAVGASRGRVRIRAVAVVNSKNAPCSPCGACRQVIQEFSTPKTTVLYEWKGAIKEMTMGELLPDSFTSSALR